MPRVLLITNDFPPIVSGISTVFYNLFRCVVEKDFVILAPEVKNSKSFDKDLSFPVIRNRIPLGESFVSKTLKTILCSFLLLYYAKKLKSEKLHCGQIISNGIGGLFCKILFSIPYIVWVYGSETIRLGKGNIIKRVLKSILDNAECVVVISEFTKAEYLNFGVDEKRIVKINPGVDTSFFRPMKRPKKLVEKFDLKGRKVIITVSRLDERKGHDKVIEALPQAIDVIQNIRYLIVGEGREKERLRYLVDKLGLNEYVIFVGYVPDEELPLYYSLCDVFVLPNRVTKEGYLKGDYEGFGIVFLEASSCGKPVIGGETGGTMDAVVQGKTGLLVNPLSSEEIASAIIELLKDNEKAEKMGREGRKRAVNNFDWNLLSKKLGEIL